LSALFDFVCVVAKIQSTVTSEASGGSFVMITNVDRQGQRYYVT
jgi:hypothetical protein